MALIIFILITEYCIVHVNPKRTSDHFQFGLEDLGLNDYELTFQTPNPGLNRQLNSFYNFIRLKRLANKHKVIEKTTKKWIWPQTDDKWKDDYQENDGDLRENTKIKQEKQEIIVKKRASKEKLKEQYINQLKNDNTTFQVNEEPNKPTLNCSGEIGYGVQAMECIVKGKKGNSGVVFYILFIWFLIGISVLLALWCLKGWCGCCFTCKFCKVHEVIDEVKVFLANNPPGHLITENHTYDYEPTAKELLYYDNLAQSLMTL